MFEIKNHLKKILTAVILASLLLAAFSILSAPSVKAAATQVNVLSFSWYTAPSNTVMAEAAGDLVIVGEIQNVGSSTLGTVSVVGLAYNSSDVILDSNNAYIPINELLPNQKAPFYIDLIPGDSVTNDTSDTGWIPSITNVTVVVNYASAATTTQYSGLTATSSNSDNSGTYTVTGTVKNTGDKTTGGVWVDTTFYNASGTVVAMNYTDYLDLSTGELAPGASVPFIATPVDNTAQLSSGITSYSEIVESQAPTGSLGGPTPTPPPSTTPTPVVTSTPTLNTGDLMIAIGVVVVVVVVLAALLLLRNRRKSAQFEPPPPPPPPP
jgi:hypothetical protein